MRALVVEDETALANLIGSYFERDGFEATISYDGLQAVALAREVDPDVVVLDLGLPSLDGVEVCRQMRTVSDAYVVMLTARSDEIDTLIGLSVGADDYLTKPFSSRVLMARVHAMLRRPRQSSELDAVGDAVAEMPTFGALSIDTDGRDVWLDGVLVALTRTEFDLLAALSARPRTAFSRRQLIDDVWGPSWVGDEHLVDVHISDTCAASWPMTRRPASMSIRTGSGAAPDATVQPTELDGPILEGADLLPAEASRLSTRDADSTQVVHLSGQMMAYRWAMNGGPYGKNDPLLITEGDRSAC